MTFFRFLPIAALLLSQPALGQHEGHAPAPRAAVADWAKGAQLFDGLGSRAEPLRGAAEPRP